MNSFGFPRFKAIDGNGNPIRGGKLYTYTAGTSTNKATYTDPELTTAHANPVVLDSNGEALIYLRGSYKMNLTTSTDAQVPGWPVDDIEGAAMGFIKYYYPNSDAADHGVTGNNDTVKYYVDTIGSTNKATIYFRHNSGSEFTNYIFLTSETVTSNITLEFEPGARLSPAAARAVTIQGPVTAPDQHIFTGAGSITFTPRVVYVAWWGAVGDGSTDDRAAIQAAANSISAGTVEFSRAASYKVLSAVDLTGKSNLVFKGNDCRMVITTNIHIFTLVNASNITFEDMRFEETGGGGGTYLGDSTGIRMTGNATGGVSQIKINNCRFEGFMNGVRGVGNVTNALNQIKEISLKDCLFYDNYHGVEFQGGYVVSNRGGNEDWTFESCVFDTNRFWGVLMDATNGTSPVISSYHSQNMKFSGCHFRNTHEEHGIYAQGRNHSIINCSFINNNVAGVRGQYVPGIKIEGCYFEGNGKNANNTPAYLGVTNTAAVALSDDVGTPDDTSEALSSRDIITANNRFFDNAAAVFVGVEKLGCVIEGNTIRNCTTTSRAAIEVQQSSQSVIAKNTISNIADAGFYGILLTVFGANRSQYSVVSENVITGADRDGIYLDRVDYVQVNDNVISSCGDAGDAGIKFNNSTYVDIHDNQCSDMTGSGILSTGTTNDWINIHNNICRGNSQYGISIPGGTFANPTHYRIRDNICVNNTTANYNVGEDSIIGGTYEYSIMFAHATIPATADTTTILRLGGITGLTQHLAETDLIIKGIIYRKDGTGGAGTFTLRPTQDGVNLGAGTAAFNASSAQGAERYSNETGYGLTDGTTIVDVTTNLGISIVTGGTWNTGCAIVVEVLVSGDAHTNYG